MKFAKITSAFTAAVLTVALTQTAFAGPSKDKVVPGKPGVNPFAPGGNIVEVALAANDALGGGFFETVYTAATCDYFEGAVAAILTGDEKVTLFAPTNAAFDALEAELGLPEGALSADEICETFSDPEAELLTPNLLLGILGYHVTDGRRFSNSVFNKKGNMKEITMLFSGDIVTKDGVIYDNNMRQTSVAIPNVNASNGVIHVIDNVLLP
jgi:uncharacterized surface protein with fasciclin (FAS1) repeats